MNEKRLKVDDAKSRDRHGRAGASSRSGRREDAGISQLGQFSHLERADNAPTVDWNSDRKRIVRYAPRCMCAGCVAYREAIERGQYKDLPACLKSEEEIRASVSGLRYMERASETINSKRGGENAGGKLDAADQRAKQRFEELSEDTAHAGINQLRDRWASPGRVTEKLERIAASSRSLEHRASNKRINVDLRDETVKLSDDDLEELGTTVREAAENAPPWRDKDSAAECEGLKPKEMNELDDYLNKIQSSAEATAEIIAGDTVFEAGKKYAYTLAQLGQEAKDMAMRVLTKEQQDVFFMAFETDSPTELANRLGIKNRETARDRLERAKRKLKKEVARLAARKASSIAKTND